MFLLNTAIAAEKELRRAEEGDLARTTAEVVVLPEPIGDPIEPVNRGLWIVNKGLMSRVVQPTAKAYRVMVPKPFRRGLRNAGKNLEFPRNAINNLLQQKWIGARDESYRFLANSVIGIGGLFDVATRLEIPRAEADFGQTFGRWGWRPKVYLMLPIAGPSNERDAVGSLADRAVNPLSYFPPYSYISYGITYNNLSETVDEYVRVSKTDFDPYVVLRYAWTLNRESRGVDMTLEGEQDPASLQTLQSVFFTFSNTNFPHLGQNRTVPITSTGRELPYTYWLQPRPAPLVYLVPGLGSHRLSSGAVALAELLHAEGFSVAAVSSTFNYEFMERGLSAPLPGYTPADAGDLREALHRIDQDLNDQYPGRIRGRVLMGMSMGGFNTLYLAGTEESGGDQAVHFDRYVAIDAPVRLTYAIAQLDEFFRAALEWPPQERTDRIEELFLKVTFLAQRLDTLTPESPIPFNAQESKFLIGLAFRLNLRDVIFLSQLQHNQGVLQQPLSKWRREPVYAEILQYSFGEYLEKFLMPYYQERGVDLANEDVLAKAVDLRSHSQALQRNERVRLVENANDILLGTDDLAWLRGTFPERNVTIFERGGHLGNLADPAVQQAILNTIADLLPEAD